jgi:hypothetical protein
MKGKAARTAGAWSRSDFVCAGTAGTAAIVLTCGVDMVCGLCAYGSRIQRRVVAKAALTVSIWQSQSPMLIVANIFDEDVNYIPGRNATLTRVTSRMIGRVS